MSKSVLRCVLGLALSVPLTAGAYEASIHQELTFIAAKQFNRCVSETEIPRLTPLQVRYIAKANATQADPGFFRRMVRWGYYDRADQEEHNALWFIETRLHGSFNRSLRRIDRADNLGERYSNLGRVVNFLQDMTSPAQVVPVFTNRWWRFSFGDRFNGYPVDQAAIEAELGDDCSPVLNTPETYPALLSETADHTITAIEQPITGMPASWEVFWKLDDNAGSFGEYGDAGNNFGRQAEFRCTRDRDDRCVLLEDDPLYAVFARERHVEAVRATMAAMAIMQQSAPPHVLAR